MTLVPPIKSQGIKTKLVAWIKQCSSGKTIERWVEPFMGTGVVAFNVNPKRALLCDTNPHVIEFYKSVQAKKITGSIVKKYLRAEGDLLLKSNGDHYYRIRERFNADGDPLDFLFLSRSCFNGMMRFNKGRRFNVPFCRKPNRFAQPLVTKITSQVDALSCVLARGDYTFRTQEFSHTLSEAERSDFIYCDPPYIGRHVDYYDSWSEEEETVLHNSLVASRADFMMSTWLKNKYRTNQYVFSLWGDCAIAIREHFYHVGAKEVNRNAIYEALLTNFHTEHSTPVADFCLYP